MPLKFHPKVGHILMCDFGDGSPHQPPEMRKLRHIVVVSKELPGRPGLCTVVPLSTTPPRTIEPYHHKMAPTSLPNKMQSEDVWAKCDMVATVALTRLDLVRTGRHPTTGKRVYFTQKVNRTDLVAIKHCLHHAVHVCQISDEPPGNV